MALVLLVFLASLFVFATVIASGKDGVQSFFGYSFLNISTESMKPSYPVGTVVITRKVDPEALKIGDIISFFSQDPAILNLPNTHRIYAIEKQGDGTLQFITKGDNNPVPDTYPVDSNRIIGVVIRSVNSVGKLINLFKNRFSLFFVFILPLLAIAAAEVKNIFAIFEKKETKPVAETCTSEKSEGDP